MFRLANAAHARKRVASERGQAEPSEFLSASANDKYLNYAAIPDAACM
jgi:hypothetical protein